MKRLPGSVWIVACILVLNMIGCSPHNADSSQLLSPSATKSNIDSQNTSDNTKSQGTSSLGNQTNSTGNNNSSETRKPANTQPSKNDNIPDREKQLMEKYLYPILKTSETFVAQGFSNFIKVKNSLLYDGNKVYRFFSVNLPCVQYNVDAGMDDKWMRSTPFEIKDAMQAVAQLGGQCARIHTLSIAKKNESIIRNVYKDGELDELMMRDLDLVIAYANKYKVRLIFPIIGPWVWIGANYDFDRLSGGPGTAYSFYHSPTTREKFKQVLYKILNRTNYYTGVKYKDDKAIMCWELGNELNHPGILEQRPESGGGQKDGLVTDEWIEDISAYIKSIDPNHLIMNGGQYDPSPGVLACKNVDIITMHYVWPLAFGTVNNSPTKITLQQFVDSGKAYVHGEFDPVNELNQAFFDKCLNDTLISGVLAWSMRGRSKTGGFLCHNDWNQPPLRWPGFNNGMPGEIWKLQNIRNYSYKMQGINNPPALPVPEPPKILPITSLNAIRFRGSAGADYYILERAESENGPWTVVSNNVIDNQYPFFMPFNDKKADPDKDYFYRMKAVNRSGQSGYSNIVPYSAEFMLTVDMEEEVFGNQFVDELNSLKKAYKISNSESIKYIQSKYKDQLNFSAITFTGNASITYKFNSDIKDYFLHIGWKNDAYKAISVQLSKDGQNFVNASPKLCDYGDANGSHFGRLEQFPVSSGYRYLRITASKRSGLEENFELNRIEINLR